MKPLIYRLIIIIFWGFVVCQTALGDTVEKYTITFSEKDFKLSNDNNGILGIFPNGIIVGYPQNMNVPKLPLLTKDIAVPASMKFVSFSVKCSKRLIRTNVTVAHTQSPHSIGSDFADTGNNIPTYNLEGSSDYPASNCQLTAQSNWSNFGILHFLACPFVYNVINKNLYFIDSMELTIVYKEIGQSISLNYANFNAESLKDLVLNPDNLDKIYYDKTPINQETRIDYLVITNESLKKSFNPLITWKKTKGIYSDIMTVEEIVSEYSGNDTPEKIKNCIFDIYKNRGLKYVLLGGDDMIIPVRDCYAKVCLDTLCEEYMDCRYIPTDLYYACFDGDFSWDGNGNGIHGETSDGINLKQSIFITRLPVHWPEHVSAFISKLLDYEQNPVWNNNMLMCGKLLVGNIGSKSDAQIAGENLYNNVIEPMWNGNRFRFYDTYTDFSGGASYDLTAENLMSELSKGYNFVSMFTHGQQEAWDLEDGYYYSINANTLSSEGHTIITTIACDTNAFDYRERTFGYRSDPCLSEAFIRNPSSGVIAYFGCSRLGWYDDERPNDLSYSLGYEATFYKNLFSKNNVDKSFGSVVALTKTSLIGLSTQDGYYRWLQFGLNPVGDPEMPIFIETPLAFDNVNFSYADGKFIIKTGIPDCRICIMSSSDGGASYYKVYENVDTVSLSDVPSFCTICITHHGYIPSVRTLRVLQNTKLSSSRSYDCDIILIGDSITTTKSKGPVIFENGKFEINASSVFMGTGVDVRKGAELKINKHHEQ